MVGALRSFQTARAFGVPVLLVRHAERGPIDDALGGWHVPITPSGRESAEALGAELATIASWHMGHSPIPRCGQTVEAIATGIRAAGAEAEIVGPIDALAGPYLRRPTEALSLSDELGNSFVREWYDGRLPGDIIAGRADTARFQLEAMLAHTNGSHGTAGLYVSHDWNVMAVREEIFGLRHEEVGWLCFLDGIAVVPHGDELVLVYGDEIRRRRRAELGLAPP